MGKIKRKHVLPLVFTVIALLGLVIGFQNCGNINLNAPVEVVEKASLTCEQLEGYMPQAVVTDASGSTASEIRFVVNEANVFPDYDVRVSQRQYRWKIVSPASMVSSNEIVSDDFFIPRPSVGSCQAIDLVAKIDLCGEEIPILHKFIPPECETVTTTTTTVTSTTQPGPSTIPVQGTGSEPSTCVGSTFPNLDTRPEYNNAGVEPPVPAFCANVVPYENGIPYGGLTRDLALNVIPLVSSIEPACPVTFRRGLEPNKYWALRFKPGPRSVVQLYAEYSGGTVGGIGNMIATVSECPGDFGPETMPLQDIFMLRMPNNPSTRNPRCIMMGMMGGFTAATRDFPGVETNHHVCKLDPNKTYYVNIMFTGHPENLLDPRANCSAYGEEGSGPCGMTMKLMYMAGSGSL